VTAAQNDYGMELLAPSDEFEKEIAIEHEYKNKLSISISSTMRIRISTTINISMNIISSIFPRQACINPVTSPDKN